MADILNMTQTAFTILSGQGEALNIDPQHFYSHVYKLLPQLSTGMCVLIQTMPAHHMHETWVLLIYCSGLTAQLLLCVSVSINIPFLISSWCLKWYSYSSVSHMSIKRPNALSKLKRFSRMTVECPCVKKPWVQFVNFFVACIFYLCCRWRTGEYLFTLRFNQVDVFGQKEASH